MMASRHRNENADIYSMVLSTTSDHANHSKSPEPLLLSFRVVEVPAPSIHKTKQNKTKQNKTGKLRETLKENHEPTAPQ
jgi:hypothetical protein